MPCRDTRRRPVRSLWDSLTLGIDKNRTTVIAPTMGGRNPPGASNLGLEMEINDEGDPLNRTAPTLHPSSRDAAQRMIAAQSPRACPLAIGIHGLVPSGRHRLVDDRARSAP